MNDIPRPPRMPSNTGPSTAPAPTDELRADIRELRAALANVGALLVRVDTGLCRLELAELTTEHRANVLTERADGHEARLRRLEGLLTDPSPLSTAAE